MGTLLYFASGRVAVCSVCERIAETSRPRGWTHSQRGYTCPWCTWRRHPTLTVTDDGEIVREDSE